VNAVSSFVPIAVTEPMITTATSAAISPYSIAVTPRSSLIKARRLLRNVSIFSVLATSARRSSDAIARTFKKVMPEHSAGRWTDTSHGSSVSRFGASSRLMPGPTPRLLQFEYLNRDS